VYGNQLVSADKDFDSAEDKADFNSFSSFTGNPYKSKQTNSMKS
jgi:hypothetical protein